MIKKLMKYVGEYKKETILTPIFVAMECAFDVIIPFLMAVLIDNGINQGNIRNIVIIGIALIICSLLAMFTGVKSGRYAARATSRICEELKKSGLLFGTRFFIFKYR